MERKLIWNPMIQRFIKLMFWSISFLLICTYLFNDEYQNTKVIEVLEKIEQLEKDGDKIYWNKIIRGQILKMKTTDQYCYVKVIIKESDNQIIKEEILECDRW